MITPKMLSGLDIINGIRMHLTNYIKESVENADDIDVTFNILTGYMATAAALDIISNEEYESSTSPLYHWLIKFRSEPVTFPPLVEPVEKYGLQEEMLLLKIKLQEHINDNLSKIREPSINIANYSKSDVLGINKLMLEFGREFNIIDEKEYKSANEVLLGYQKGNPKILKVLFVPEQFYTKTGKNPEI